MSQFENIYPFLNLFNLVFIKGSFISLLLIIIYRLVCKKKFHAQIPVTIFKWLLIINSCLSPVFYIAEFAYAWYGGVEYQQYAFSERMTGPYAGFYWFMLIAHFLLPFILLVPKLGGNIYCVLVIAVFVNTGWLMESLVIHTNIMYRDGVSSGQPYLPFRSELWTIGYGLLWGVVSILITHYVNIRSRIAMSANR
ncbi:hypothetical protein [Mucilaginibacter pedocola]|uniref:Uncharacterized protein n=1 Tax=Mucilaginibacter pedocola TaxID=1792845 RepID=A0A1S9PIQ2_9SPHI|nr:hypothetical protein [Mucilaginibacter pedocola]OOQ60822.1 hypothetical protein BC343_22910 [Mucilaginibacter pedocola]